MKKIKKYKLIIYTVLMLCFVSFNFIYASSNDKFKIEKIVFNFDELSDTATNTVVEAKLNSFKIEEKIKILDSSISSTKLDHWNSFFELEENGKKVDIVELGGHGSYPNANECTLTLEFMINSKLDYDKEYTLKAYINNELVNKYKIKFKENNEVEHIYDPENLTCIFCGEKLECNLKLKDGEDLYPYYYRDIKGKKTIMFTLNAMKPNFQKNDKNIDDIEMEIVSDRDNSKISKSLSLSRDFVLQKETEEKKDYIYYFDLPDEISSGNNVINIKIGGYIIATGKISVNLDVKYIFKDVNENYWAYSAIMNARNLGIIDGFEDGSFRPDSKITKEQFAKILVEALKLEKKSNKKLEFNDVPESRWSYKYIDILSQYLDSNIKYFEPESYAKREDVAEMLIKALGLEKEEYKDYNLYKFFDYDKISKDKEKYVAIASKYKLMNGNTSGYFEPTEGLSRAEVVTIISNVLNLNKKEIDEKISTLPSIDFAKIGFYGEKENISNKKEKEYNVYEEGGKELEVKCSNKNKELSFDEYLNIDITFTSDQGDTGYCYHTFGPNSDSNSSPNGEIYYFDSTNLIGKWIKFDIKYNKELIGVEYVYFSYNMPT